MLLSTISKNSHWFAQGDVVQDKFKSSYLLFSTVSRKSHWFAQGDVVQDKFKCYVLDALRYKQIWTVGHRMVFPQALRNNHDTQTI